MTSTKLRRAGAVCVLLIVVAVLSGTGLVHGTFALFNGETQNANSVFAGGWVAAPTGLTATPSGYDVGLAWTPGTAGVTGQQLWGVDRGTTNNCTGASYALVATLASATTSSYTHANIGSGSADGDWYCYEVLSTHGSWTTAQTIPALQIGLAATAVTITNNNNTIANGDTVVVTFNQRTNLAAASGLRVCAFTSGAIVLRDTSGGCTSASDANTFGVLTVSGATIGAKRAFTKSSLAVSSSAPWTATITLGGGTNTTATGGTWTFAPSTSIRSNATTDQATICTATNGNCQPSTTTHF